MEKYPQFFEVFEQINAQTFDLMDMVSSKHEFALFRREFSGSASIKHVLPAMTDLTYAGMEVSNGKDAAESIQKLITTENIQKRKALLEYCRQDTWAMVEIYREILGEMG